MAVLNFVENMRDMRDELEAYALRVGREEVEEDDEGNNKKVKTYLIESNIPAPKPNDLFKVFDTKDPNLKMLESRGQTKFLFYIDTSNERFWQVHTADPAYLADRVLREYIVKNNSKLDFSWFYSNFLEQECAIGNTKGFKLRFRDLFSHLPEGSNGEEPNIERFSMLFWGGKASEIIGALRETTLVEGVNLSAILTKYFIGRGFSKENIQNNGKFTLTKTNSIDSHLNAVNKISEKYEKHIHKIESGNRIVTKVEGGRVKIEGTYASIKLRKKIENIEQFIAKVFSGTRPFRLFGVSQKIESEYYKIFGVDLHTTSKFDMEILPEEIRVYLDESACGNVIPRLLTNLQSNFSSEITYNSGDLI